MPTAVEGPATSELSAPDPSALRRELGLLPLEPGKPVIESRGPAELGLLPSTRLDIRLSNSFRLPVRLGVGAVSFNTVIHRGKKLSKGSPPQTRLGCSAVLLRAHPDAASILLTGPFLPISHLCAAASCSLDQRRPERFVRSGAECREIVLERVWLLY